MKYRAIIRCHGTESSFSYDFESNNDKEALDSAYRQISGMEMAAGAKIPPYQAQAPFELLKLQKGREFTTVEYSGDICPF